MSCMYMCMYTHIGKILRASLRQVANNYPFFKIPATVDDPAIFKSFEGIIRQFEGKSER